MQKSPELRKEDGIWTLFADGKPFTMLCGEVHNSSASDAGYMEEQVWPFLKGLHINSLLVPVYWEMIERQENVFDFTVLDAIIKQAERESVKLGILWFGLWKNGISSYTPEWVKTDQKRFFRAADRNNRPMDVVSPFCQAAVDADAKAFGRLMEHIGEKNEEQQTVILVQVENEVGLLGSDRDYSRAANELFGKEIPDGISSLYEKSGTWEQAFGEEAPEVFMEYAYAKAVGRIAKSGKRACPLPMCVNAWIEKFPWRPGGYPSGGPIARFGPLWKMLAPDIDILCPDVYTSDFQGICREYRTADNPLLIPEHRRDIKNISHLFYAVGTCQTLCFSPFGIEDFLMPPETRTGIGNPDVMKILNIDRNAWECEKTGEFLGWAYQLLDSAMEVIYRYQKLGKVYGFLRENEHEKGTVIHLTNCDIRIDYLDQKQDTPKAAGFIIESGEGEFYAAGVNFRYSLLPLKSEKRQLGILEYSEGRFENGMFKRGRILNGDERYCMLMLEKPELQRVKWYFYQED